MALESLSSDVFERRTLTESGLFALLSRDFEHIFWANRLHKIKVTKYYRFGSVKAFTNLKMANFWLKWVAA